MEQEYITNPNINGGEPIPVYEMGKVVPGSPLWEVIQQQQKENSPYLTAATAREIKSYIPGAGTVLLYYIRSQISRKEPQQWHHTDRVKTSSGKLSAMKLGLAGDMTQ